MKKKSARDALKQLRENRELGIKHSEQAGSDSDDDMYEYLSEGEYESYRRKLKEEGDFVVDDDGTGYKDDYGEESRNVETLKRSIVGSSKKQRGNDSRFSIENGKTENIRSMFTKMAKKTGHDVKKEKAMSIFSAEQNALEKEAETAITDVDLKSTFDELIDMSTSSKRIRDKELRKSKKRKGGKDAGAKTETKLRKSGKGAISFDDWGGYDEGIVSKAPVTDEDQEQKVKTETKEPEQADESEAFTAADVEGKESSQDNITSTSGPDIRSQLLQIARSKPLPAAPKLKPPATPPPVRDDAEKVTFMSTPPPGYGSLTAEENGSGWCTPSTEIKSDTVSTEVGDASPQSANSSNHLILQKDGNGDDYLDFFLIDMYEDYYNNSTRGIVYLFGKVFCERAGAFVSFCLQVNNVERALFFLPKASFDVSAVREEVKETVIGKLVSAVSGQRQFRTAPTKLKYAFELPDVPLEETEYLQVRYPLSAENPNQRLNPESKGKTFARVFGTNQSAIERITLDRGLKGPIWVRAKNLKFVDRPTTWCKYHAFVDKALHVTPLSRVLLEECNANDVKTISVPPAPKLRVLSLTIKTCLNEKHQHEVAVISGLSRDNVDLVGATEHSSNPRKINAFTLMRNDQRGKLRLPSGAKELINKGFSHITVAGNERALLSLLTARMNLLDPDVILCHNGRQFEIPTLIRRMTEVGCHTWHKLGRLRLSRPPRTKADGSFFPGSNPCVGRLLLDSLVTARELLIGQRSYALSELCRTQLNRPRFEIQPAQVPWFYEAKDRILKLATHNEADAWLTLQLAFKLEALPVTLQLSSLAGNLWSRTLAGGRAERIEYLLLHEFFRQGYLLPDKLSGLTGESERKKQANHPKNHEEQVSNDDNPKLGKGGVVDGGSKKRGKAKYGGGLVLEPKKGLYNTYVLLLDFNSLYPSIIQEYNICYTTVSRERGKKEDAGHDKRAASQTDHEFGEVEDTNRDINDELPDLPDRSVHQELAVVPRLIKNLVDRRREVKRLLGKEKDPTKASQLDVRQKALKITANSMYGCLGFTGFRFFAQPVAALVTSQGRQILSSAVNVAQDKLGYDVVYGDTDSIMVNTSTNDLKTAKEAGLSIKREINKLYGLLEIEQDGIFKTLVLLKKKKYAALVVTGEKKLPSGEVEIITDKETKGLDMVRRDWCQLSKRIGNQVLDFILNGSDHDEIVEGIEGYLEEVKNEILEDKVPLGEYTINKGLNKNPKDYPDAKSQPHLGVALAMVEAGKPVSTGDSIPYIICTCTRSDWSKRISNIESSKESEAKSSVDAAPLISKDSSYAERAFHPDEIKADKFGVLKVDKDWYLNQQVVPPTQRLCDPISGISAGQIARCLGLDPSRFSNHTRDDDEYNDHQIQNVVDIRDSERYKDCKKLIVSCKRCTLEYPFCPGGIAMPSELQKTLESADNTWEKPAKKLDMTQAENGLFCPRCELPIDLVWLSNKAFLEARDAVHKYYMGWLTSDDPSIDIRTRQQTVMGSTFSLNGRRFQLQPEYTAKQLYLQLKYLGSLFDTDRALDELAKINSKQKQSETFIKPAVLSAQDRSQLDRIKTRLHDEYILRNGYNWISHEIFNSVFKVR